MPKQLQTQKQEDVPKKEEKTAKEDEQTMIVDNDAWVKDLKALFNTEKVLTATQQKSYLFGPMRLKGQLISERISLAVFIRTKIFGTGVESFKEHRDFTAVNTSRSFFDKGVVSLLESSLSQNLAAEFEQFYKNFCKQEDNVKIDGGENVVKMEIASGEDGISGESASKAKAEDETEKASVMSEELKLKLEQMYASLPPQHELVYPPPPPPGSLRIPIGKFAKCQCKEGCEFELAEPAYGFPAVKNLLSSG
ncbi:hypothetical protein GCK72_025407 [Caenorhabditis remanei]|uniref:Uncharacterized protein n=1 Tax=Caenorhabditis remanei TaxID=31234 RepID=A0A6A5G1V6_CAERE|nr:hypothetical protein GCK72_025407 [Caenorhabditis remanei]KAF1748940.1 hypothetical protein GCK72_025407 [Caenorhabditis remanei]